MSKVIVCDRCKEAVKKREPSVQMGLKDQHSVGNPVIYDLCEKCHDELGCFIAGRKLEPMNEDNWGGKIPSEESKSAE